MDVQVRWYPEDIEPGLDVADMQHRWSMIVFDHVTARQDAGLLYGLVSDTGQLYWMGSTKEELASRLNAEAMLPVQMEVEISVTE